MTATDPLALPPAAFLGYKPDWSRGLLYIRCCAWCETKAAAERMAAEMGCKVTHDICPACAAKLIAQVTGDKTDEG